MKVIVISIGIIVVVVAVFLWYKDYFVRRKFRTLALLKFKALEPVMNKVAAQESIPTEDLSALAKDPSLRYALFRVLDSYQRTDLFPSEYFTREKGAEGFLVNWLEFPTELGKPPDEIELLTIVSLAEENALDYYVFKYKTNPPHWASALSWMMGVSGPYTPTMLPFDVPLRVFSRFHTLSSFSPEAEVQWVHEHIGHH